MRARDIIERLAALDEAPVAYPEPDVEEPQVEPAEPDTEPAAPPPAPAKPDRPSPFRAPTRRPGVEPRPKARNDAEDIRNWLDITEQPVDDWDWDGQTLKLLLIDGSVESYSREQLDEIGVFGQVAFAEAKEPDTEEDEDEDEPDAKPESNEPEEPEANLPDETEDSATGDNPVEYPESDNAGQSMIIHGILGVEDQPAEPAPEAQLAQAVSDLVQAIIGVAKENPTSNLCTPEN